MGENCSKIKITGTCIEIKINGFSWNVEFSKLKDLAGDLILGCFTIKETRLLMDLRKNMCYFSFKLNVKIALGHIRDSVIKYNKCNKIG